VPVVGDRVPFAGAIADEVFAKSARSIFAIFGFSNSGFLILAVSEFSFSSVQDRSDRSI
jgi:hypothetical protein